MFTITVHGPAGSGKTTLLNVILEAFADHGFLSVEDTQHLTNSPLSFMSACRGKFGNGNLAETITVDLDLMEIWRLAVMNDTSQPPN